MYTVDMSRRLVIGILIVLIVGILGGTVVFVVQRLRGDDPEPLNTTPSLSNLDPAREGQATVVSPNEDTDGDGLTNAEESIWGTDPKNADTDGDSYRDGEEVTASHNPTIPGPNDKLPAGFNPQQNLQPLAAAPLQVDQFFAADLDLTGPKENLTESYQKQYKEEERTAISLATFTNSQPLITKLPTPKEGSIVLLPTSSANDLVLYLAAVENLEPLANKSGLDSALQNLIQDQDISGFQGLAIDVRHYQADLAGQSVPASALNLHRLLLGYTELLAATFDQITVWPQDQLKSMLGMRQLETIDKQYYPLIVAEMNRLRDSVAR